MRILFTLAILLMSAGPALAVDDEPPSQIPEPGVLALIGIGAAAVLIGRRNKK